MNPTAFAERLKQNFPFAPTPIQEKALQSLADFFASSGENEVFLLKGFAGTGTVSYTHLTLPTKA